MALPLSGKVAIVTGASTGIGASIAKRLAADGADVVVNFAWNAAPADELVAFINAQRGGKAVAVEADLSTIAGGKHLLDESLKVYGKLDILVFNAALLKHGSLSNITEEDFDRHFNTNVKVPLFMTQAAAPHLKPGSRLIFLSTSFTKYSAPPPEFLLYTSSKGAVEHFVRILAKDLGTRGITVNAISPGAVDTEMFRLGKTEQQIQFFANLHPQKRIADPDEVTPIVSFLAKEEAGWVNGQIVGVNGGFTIG